MNLVKTVYVPHDNVNMIFPIHDGRAVMDIIWIYRPSTWWKKISRKIYLKKLRKFRIELKKAMIYLAEEHDATDLIFGVKNNEAPSMWEMAHNWREYGPRDIHRSI